MTGPHLEMDQGGKSNLLFMLESHLEYDLFLLVLLHSHFKIKELIWLVSVVVCIHTPMTKFLYWSVRITRAAINWYIWLYVASSLNILEIHKNIYPKGLTSLLTIQQPIIFKIWKTKTFNQFLNTEIETEKQIDYKAYKQLLLHHWHCSLHNWITLILEIIAWNEMKLQKRQKQNVLKDWSSEIRHTVAVEDEQEKRAAVIMRSTTNWL